MKAHFKWMQYAPNNYEHLSRGDDTIGSYTLKQYARLEKY